MALTKQFIEMQEAYETKITDLEAKLAESEKAFDTISAKYEKKSKQIFETIKCQEACSDAYDLLSKENDQLKQQLKEKDKVIENLRIDLKDWQELEKKLGTKYDKVVEQLTEEKNRNKKLNHEAQKYYEDAYCNGSQNQTAIEELENVIDLAEEHCQESMPFGFHKIEYGKLREIIYQQIAKLKGDV